MAKNTYYIVFENNDRSGVESPVAENRDSTGSGKGENDAKALINGVKGYASLGYAISVVDRVATSNINMVALRTGHEELQQRMQFAYGLAKQGAGVVQSAVMGGSVGGWVGAVVGAVVGVADTMINIGIKQNQIDTQRNVENQSLHFNRIRAGAGQDRTGRTQ